MKITLFTVGSHGDIQPYIPLALGLQQAGFDITIATHGPYEDFVRGYGLDFSPVVGDPRAVMSGEGGIQWLETGRNPLSFLRRFRDLANDMMEQMGRDCLTAADGADVLLFSSLGFFAGAPVAEKLGIPAVGAYLQPVSLTAAFPGIIFPQLPDSLPLQRQYNHLTHTLMMEMTWRLFRGPLNNLRRSGLGLPPEKRPFRQTINDPYPVVYGFSRHVIPKPADWGDHLHISGFWFLDDAAWEPSQALCDFLDAGPAPVYVGFGSMTNRDVEATTHLVIEAIRKSGQRAVLLSGWAGIGSSDLPDAIFRLEYAPHGWLFPRMAAVVHHGGAGTTAAGLRAGVPSLLVPHFADQPFWGRRLNALGVGPGFIPRKQLTLDNLAAAIRLAATDEAMRQRAASLGEKIRAEDGVASAVQFIEQVVEKASFQIRT